MSKIWVEHASGEGGFLPADSPSIRSDDRGFAYGDGLFETIRVAGGVPLFFDRHYDRLRAGLSLLKIPPLHWDKRTLAARSQAAIRENATGDGVLKIIITRGTGQRGFDPPAAPSPTLIVQTAALPARSAQPASAVIAPWRVDPSSPLCRVKHLSALDKVLARLYAGENHADEALFVNTNGCLAEGAASNLFVVRGKTIFTPPLHCGLLAGVARGLLCEAGAELAFPVVEAEITPQHLAEADEAFLTNVVSGVRPLASVDHRPIGDGRPSPATEMAGSYFRRCCRGEIARIIAASA